MLTVACFFLISVRTNSSASQCSRSSTLPRAVCRPDLGSWPHAGRIQAGMDRHFVIAEPIQSRLWSRGAAAAQHRLLLPQVCAGRSMSPTARNRKGARRAACGSHGMLLTMHCSRSPMLMPFMPMACRRGTNLECCPSFRPSLPLKLPLPWTAALGPSCHSPAPPLWHSRAVDLNSAVSRKLDCCPLCCSMSMLVLQTTLCHTFGLLPLRCSMSMLVFKACSIPNQ